MPSTQVQAGPLGARVCDFFSRTARLTFRGGRRNLDSGFPERERGGRGIPRQLTAQAQAFTNRRGRGEHEGGRWKLRGRARILRWSGVCRKPRPRLLGRGERTWSTEVPSPLSHHWPPGGPADTGRVSQASPGLAGVPMPELWPRKRFQQGGRQARRRWGDAGRARGDDAARGGTRPQACEKHSRALNY